MRSNLWQYFGFPADSSGNILTRKKIICTLCKSVLAYNKNTTNLKSHINAKHREFEVQIKKMKVTEAAEGTSINQTTKNWEKHETKPKYMKLMNETIKDNEFDIEILDTNSMDELEEDENYSQLEVEDNDETEFVFDEPPEIISPEKTFNMKTAIINWLTTDLLSTSTLDGLGFQRMIRILGDGELPNKEEILDELNIIYSHTHSENFSKVQESIYNRHFSLSFEKWENFENNAFITVYINYLDTKINDFEFLNNVVDVLYLDPMCSERIDWDDYFINHSFINFDRCSGAVLDFDEEELIKFLNKKKTPIIQCLINTFRKSIENCFDLNSVKELIKLDSNKFWLEKWKLLENSNNVQIQEIFECLNPLEKALEGLSMEQIVNPALSFALITQLCEIHFTPDPETDLSLTQEIKTVIKDSLLSCLPKANESGIFLLLDPRFKDFARDEDVDDIKTKIRKINGPGPLITEKKIVIKTEGNDKRKSHFGFLFNRDNYKRKVEKTDVLDDELKNYREIESDSLEICPVAWWMENGYSYPNLKKIADIFNCVSACVSTQSKIKFDERIDFHKKIFYCSDEPSILEKLIFLHLNFK